MLLTLREWRRAKEISQTEMATMLNVHPQTYMKWEKEPEKISWGKAVEISEILGISINDISFSAKAKT